MVRSGTDIEQLAREKISESGNPNMSIDDAVEEIVCNASERMLLNTKYAELMEKEKPNLFGAIRKWLSGLRDRILKIFEGEGYSRENAYKEAKILWDVMDEMQEIWDRAMVQAQSSRLDGRQQRESGSESGSESGTGADVKSKAKFSLREKKTPTYEELVSKTPVRIVDVRNGIESGTYAEMKGEVLEKAIEEKWFDEPHLNEDTNSLIFLTPKSFSHAFTNLTADFGEDTIRSMAHIPEIIKDAVLVSVNEPKNNRKAETGVYTFFGAINGANGIEPVKLTVKEYDFKSLDGMPQNIRSYFNRNGIMEQYDTLYDTQALEVIGIESIKEEPDASVKVGEQSPRAQDTSDSSEIKVADLLELVKGDAEKYIPERGEQFKGSSRETRDTAEEAKGREESAAVLRRENRILRERIEYWKKQSRVTKEYTLRNTDTFEYARELVKRLDSAATSAEVNQGLQEMGAYLLNAENVDWDMLWEHALTLAHSMTDDVDIVISDEMKAEREDFESFLKSVPVDVAPLVKAGEISYSDLKGYPIVHRKNGTSIDDLYQQLQERFGEGIFPDVPDGGDMIDNIKRYADAEVLTKKMHKVIIDEVIFYLDVLLPDKMSILPGSAPSGKSAAISAEGVFS